jgi:hypothetical protein
MTYPLVRDLAAEEVPVAVTCRVLKFSKQGYFKWLNELCCERDLENAYLSRKLLSPGAGGLSPAAGRRCWREMIVL